MFTILIQNDNVALITERQRIMQKSKLVDEFRFLVEPEYKNCSMADFILMMQYLTPATHKHRSEVLELASTTYKDYLQYNLPIDTDLTSEAGEIELQLTFSCVELDENGKFIQHVRKISPFTITILPISIWADIVPDEALNAIDQRLIMVNAQIKAMEDIQNAYDNSKADDLSYEGDQLQLLANGNKIGRVVKIASGESLEDGIPAVDMDSVVGGNINKDDETDNVVEF